MRYKWMLFDADGTLFDYEQAEAVALQKSFQQSGFAFEAEYAMLYRQINEKVWKAYERGEISQTMLRTGRFRQLFEQVGVEANTEPFSETYLCNLAECSDLIDGAEEIIRTLYGKVGLVIITNGLKIVQRPRLAGSAIGSYFADVVISDEVGAAKPDRRIFDAAFSKMGHPRKEAVLMVGDSLTADMKGGYDYGIDTCWFNPAGRSHNQDLTIHYEIGHLHELLHIL